MEFKANSADDCAMALKTGQLEWKYQKSLLLSTQLLDAERSRAKSLDQLYLEFENDDLRSQLDRANDELTQATKATHEARALLRDACEEVDRLQSITQTPSHTSDSLHKEIATLRRAASESEKHLAENHSLRRQLDALKGQFESEKDARGHAWTKEPHQAEEITDLTKRLEEARKQLSEETEARSRQERNSQQQSREWETQRTALESKLGSLQQKLKSMKDQLREAKSNARAANASQQRSSVRYDADMAIGTPGPVQTQLGAKRSMALPGDKSAFSITPFLNRTSAPQDPQSSSENDSEELHEASEAERRPSKGKTSDRGRIGNPKPRNEPQESQGSPSRGDLNKHEPKPGKISSRTNPDTKPHRADGEDLADDPSTVRDQSTTGLSMNKSTKRKLGAQRDNSPDNDAGSIMKPGRKLALGAGRKPAVSLLEQPNSPDVGLLARLPRNRMFSGATDFSPLKRDRR